MENKEQLGEEENIEDEISIAKNEVLEIWKDYIEKCNQNESVD